MLNMVWGFDLWALGIQYSPDEGCCKTLTTTTAMTTPVSVLGVYRKFPRELFRLNKGVHIRLREHKSRRGPLFDVVANDRGNIEPRALDLTSYAGNNTATCSHPF
jgi:hypothetical protein